MEVLLSRIITVIIRLTINLRCWNEMLIGNSHGDNYKDRGTHLAQKNVMALFSREAELLQSKARNSHGDNFCSFECRKYVEENNEVLTVIILL